MIQQPTGQILLTYLLAVSVDDNAFFQTKEVVGKASSDFKKFIEVQLKLLKDESLSAHLMLASGIMKSPEKARPTIHKEIPPGALIGFEWEE